MSQPYAKQLPNDRNQTPLQDFPPARLAVARNYNENNTVSSIITLGSNTTNLEIGTMGATGAVFRWVASTDTQASVIGLAGATSNFDHFIPINTVRKFVVPVESQGLSSVVGLQAQAGLYARIAVKSVGAASVLTTQY